MWGNFYFGNTRHDRQNSLRPLAMSLDPVAQEIVIDENVDNVLHSGALRERLQNGPFPVTKMRFFVLFFFSVLNLNQCLSWFSFSSLSQETLEEYFGQRMTPGAINLFLNWGPIIGVLVYPLQRILAARKGGFRSCVVLGIALSVLSAVTRTTPIIVSTLCGDSSYRQGLPAFICYHTAQILNAAVGPLIMSSVTQLSVIWFPENERTTATAVAQTSNGLGMAVGFLAPLTIARSESQTASIFYLTAALTAIPVVCSLAYFPEAPEFAPSAAALVSQRREETREKGDSSNSPRSFVVLIVMAAVLAGVSDGWQGCFQSILGDTLSEQTIGLAGFVNCIAGNISAVAVGFLIDRIFRRKMKAAILISLGLCLACTVWFAIQVAEGVSSEAWLILCITLQGVFKDATSPLFYELSAELLYPQKESVSAGYLVLLLNLSAGVMIALDDVLAGDVMNLVMIAVLGLVIVAIGAGVTETYKRPTSTGEGG